MTLESMTETVSKKIYFLLQEKCFFLTYFLIGVAGTRLMHSKKQHEYSCYFSEG